MSKSSRVYVETDVEHLKQRSDVRLPSSVVWQTEDRPWVMFEDVCPEMEDFMIDEAGNVDLSSKVATNLLALCRDIDCRIAIVQGYAVADYYKYILLDRGECARFIQHTQECWAIAGDAIQPWESEVVEQEIDDEHREEIEAYEPTDQVVIRELKLQHGASLPICGPSTLEKAAGLDGLALGERIAVRERSGFLKRLFGR